MVGPAGRCGPCGASWICTGWCGTLLTSRCWSTPSKGRRNRYASRLKRQVTIRLDDQTIKYFKAISGECGIPYQTLINLYLRDCAATGKRLALNWKSVA
jgi:uncharacterized protein (DUF4415 family)